MVAARRLVIPVLFLAARPLAAAPPLVSVLLSVVPNVPKLVLAVPKLVPNVPLLVPVARRLVAPLSLVAIPAASDFKDS
jgi:hypothetical protein